MIETLLNYIVIIHYITVLRLIKQFSKGVCLKVDSELMNKINDTLNWIARLAYLNLLWIFFIVLGGIVFGFIPSTVAMFSVIRKWLQQHEDFPVIHHFFKVYKQEFIKSNLLGVILILVGIFIYVDSQLIPAFNGSIKIILLGSFMTVTILYLLVLFYIFPLFVHYKNGVFQYIKSALFIGISYPLRSLLMGISILSMLFICFVFPAISFLFLGSGIGLIIMCFSNHLLMEIAKEQVILD